MAWKYRNRLCQNLKFRILGKLGFGKLRNRNTKTWNSISICSFWDGNSKSIPKIQNSGFNKWEIGTSKREIWFRFWILMPQIWFSKFQNRFLQFLSNFDLGPKNLKSAMSKTPKSSFSLQNSYFRFKFFFDQNLDFVLGRNEYQGAWSSLQRRQARWSQRATL